MSQNKIMLLVWFGFLLGGFLCIPLTNAIDFDLNERINLTTIQCQDVNGTICTEEINCTITIVNSTSDNLFLDYNMTNTTNGFYIFDTGLSYGYEISLSAVTTCTNSGSNSFTIDIAADEDEVNTLYTLYGLLLAVSCVFVIFSFTKKETLMYPLFAGFIFIVLGVSFIYTGFPNVQNSFITENSGIVIAGIGFFLVTSQIGRLL